MVKRILLYTGIQEIIIFLLIIWKETALSFRAYSNIAFLVGFALFLITLLVYIMQTGFFDRVHHGFRGMLRKVRGEDEDDRYASMMLSELVSLRFANLMISAAIVTLSSFITALL